MFTPLSYNKPHIEKIDRFDNSGIADSPTTTKRGGYGVPPTNTFSETDVDATIFIQAWPNSDDVRCTGRGGGEKWYLWCAEPSIATSAWWQLCIPTANNQQVGGGSDYDLLDNTTGVLKGQIMVPFRIRPSGGANEDGLILIDSGSIYDWTDPQPISIALAVQHGPTAVPLKASINGVTKPVRFEGRGTQTPNSASAWTDVQLTGTAIQLTWGYDARAFDEALMSGSYYHMSYWSSSLSQEELNYLTAQPIGTPLAGIPNKQPQMSFTPREEQKETVVRTGLTGQLSGPFAFPNLGNTTAAAVSQLVTVNQQAGQITSGSVYDIQTDNYRGRI